MSDRELPNYQLIEPSRIPGRTIDVGQIQDAAQLLSTTAAAIRTHGSQVEAEWDALAGVYDAPEAPDLFHIMKGTHGVGSLARELADACSRVAGALSALAFVIDTYVRELRNLHQEAVEFRATIHDGLVDVALPISPTEDSTMLADRVEWPDHLPTRLRNTDLIQAVNAAFAKLDEAQAVAVNEINAVNPSMLDTLRARYAPITLDELNSADARLPYGAPRTPGTCSDENIGGAVGLWLADTANGVTTRFGYDIYDGEFSWATAINARASGLMTEVGLLLFASPVTWILQQSLTNARRSPGGLSVAQTVLSDFINGAGDHAAGAVEGFTQWNTWATDPGKAGTNVVLNVGSIFSPVGKVTAPMKAMASAKAGALVERIADIGTKIGGPRGEAFGAGVKAAAYSGGEALKAVNLVRGARGIISSELMDAVKARIPIFTPGEIAVDSSNGAAHHSAHPSTTRYDPANYNPDGSIAEPDYGELSPARRAELLRQRAAHEAFLHRSAVESDSRQESDESPNVPEPLHEPAQLDADAGGDASDPRESGNSEDLHAADPIPPVPQRTRGWLLDGGAIDTTPYWNAEPVRVPVGASDLRYVDFTTDPGEAIFWSGRTNGVGGDGMAAAIASSHGGSTLEQLLRDRLVAMPEFDPGVSSSVDSWREASLRLAEHAQGDVHAVLGSRMRPGSIWETVEFPALKANPAVTRVYSVDPKSGAVSLLWERAK